MRNITLSIIILAMWGCHYEKKPVHFVQENEVALATPLLKASGSVIDSVSSLSASLALPGVDIRYTTDGSLPNNDSKKYEGELKVTESGVYNFRAFHPDFIPSEVSSVTFFKAGLTVDKILMENEVNPKYPGRGVHTLIDLQKGSNNFSDGKWMGFEEDVVIILKLPENSNAKTIGVGYMSAIGAWIFSPEKITVWTSDDGDNYVEAGNVELETETENASTTLKNASVTLNNSANYLKIKIENLKKIPEWHDGTGQNAWLFLDEILIW